jgi:hypothetical protein
MSDKDRDLTPTDRVLSYGDAVVAQGNVATQTKVVPPPTPPPPPPVEVVTLILIDRRSLVSDSMRTSLTTRLTRDLNALGVVKSEPDVLKAQSLRFEVRWESKRPNASQQASYGKWDFPLYFEKAHTSDNFAASEVADTMRAHGIRNAGKAASQYSEADAGWQNKAVEGLGIQPLQGYRKVGFLKVDQISGRANDVETAYANVLKHELGHMCNITQHASAGLMTASVPIANPKVTFVEDDQRAILRELVRLKLQTEAVMQRAYEQRNR